MNAEEYFKEQGQQISSLFRRMFEMRGKECSKDTLAMMGDFWLDKGYDAARLEEALRRVGLDSYLPCINDLAASVEELGPTDDTMTAVYKIVEEELDIPSKEELPVLVRQWGLQEGAVRHDMLTLWVHREMD